MSFDEAKRVSREEAQLLYDLGVTVYVTTLWGRYMSVVISSPNRYNQLYLFGIREEEQ